MNNKIESTKSIAHQTEEIKQQITYINIDKLFPHKDNPRKDIGDISELIESIRENGIYQNLTVVSGEKEDTYTVVIGHRRLAAAKAAGLSKVPCIISNMDYKKQLSTMLLENMQRSDLSVYEQALAFKQLVFDFGATVSEISEKTGFSSTTIRKRLEIAKLDEKKLKALSGKQVTIADFDELSKIKDIETRNRLLDDIGTNNFQYSVASAQRKEKKEEAMKKLRPIFNSFATEIKFASNMVFCTNYAFDVTPEQIIIPKDKDTVKYYWTDSYSGISVYKNAKKSKVDPEEEKRKKILQAKIKSLNEIAEICYISRRNFIAKGDFNNVSDKDIFAFICQILTAVQYHGFNKSFIRDIIHSDITDGYSNFTDEERNAMKAFSSKKTAVQFVYACCEDDKDIVSHNSCGHLKEKTDYGYSFIRDIYAAFEHLGYEMSDEERAYVDGTHNAYKNEELGETKNG